MARYTEARCRLCRREGMKLLLKGDRCFSDKCSFNKRPNAPGQHTQMRKAKVSDYGIRLREKQKVRRLYMIQEAQFRKYFQMADKQKGVTGINLLVFLERRLDNVLYRLGLAESRSQARQMITHNLFKVNNKKMNIPSYLVGVGDVISVTSEPTVQIKNAVEAIARRGIPDWLEFDYEKYQGTVKSFPDRQFITMPIKEQYIVEFYSK